MAHSCNCRTLEVGARVLPWVQGNDKAMARKKKQRKGKDLSHILGNGKTGPENTFLSVVSGHDRGDGSWIIV